MKRIPKVYRKFIIDKINYWKKCFPTLAGWEIYIGHEFESPVSGHPTRMFSVSSNVRYLNSTIWIWEYTYELWKANPKDKELDLALVHELCHILIAPLCDLAGERFASEDKLGELNDQLSESIARIIMKLKEPK